MRGGRMIVGHTLGRWSKHNLLMDGMYNVREKENARVTSRFVD